MRVRTRILVTFLAIALLPLITIGLVFFMLGENAFRDQVLRQLQSTASIQKERVKSLLQQDFERLSLMESRTLLRQSLQSFSSNRDQASLNAMTASLKDAQSSIPDFKTISVLGLDGTMIASTDPSRVGKSQAGESYFQLGKEGNDVGVFFLGPDNNLMQYLTGPLVINGEKLGVLAIESEASAITGMMKDYSGLGKTGETVIAEKTPQGDSRFLGPTRFGTSKPLSVVVPGQKANVPINVALGKNVTTLTNARDYRGKPVLATTQYISDPPLGLAVKIDRSEAFSTFYNLLGVLGGVMALVIVVVIVVSITLARSITRPVLALAGVAESVGAGDLSRRADVDRDDELGTLARAFNQMTDDLVAEREGLETKVEERTAELARSNIELDGYAHTVSHDLRSPLTSIHFAGSVLSEMFADPESLPSREEVSEIVDQIKRGTARAFSLVENLLELAEAGREPTQVEAVDVNETVRRVLQELDPRIRSKGVRVVVDDDLGTVVANPTQAYQLFGNLIGNAVKHNDAAVPVVELRRIDDAPGGTLHYQVKDNGSGIGEDDLPRIFEPFFKGKGGETGIGLATVQKIVELHGGTISACNAEEGGACFEFVFPDYRSSASPG
jgi:signal transduction histidine kinase